MIAYENSNCFNVDIKIFLSTRIMNNQGNHLTPPPRGYKKVNEHIDQITIP